ncbi:MAG TPA: transporter [Gemmatimonadaceae bacterium]|nr:transporter [Gemmatimonadaceae bacterium]
MRRILPIVGCTLGLIGVLPATASAQRLRDRISELFIFGPGQDPLFLAGSATSSNPMDIQVHGRHYLPSAAAENGSVIAFVTGALASRVANVPIGATTSGETFRFEGGVPISTSTSAGPIFAERAQTLGRGRILAGINQTNLSFTSLRGVPLGSLRLVFTHENVDFPGCSEQQQADCSQMGVPVLENDIMQFDLALDINVAVTSFFVTYGLNDHVDVGVVLPLMRNSITGESRAEILPFGGTTATHFFAGTTANPVLQASRTTSGSAFGIGDVAVRVKLNARQTATGGVGLLLDARLPTGDENDLLGAGSFSGRVLGILSSTFGAFSPHVNAGYLYSAGENRNDLVLLTVGFDHLLARGVTLAVDAAGEFQVGESRLLLPGPVVYDSPFRRTITPTSIPDIRDDVVNGSFGFKFTLPNRLTIVTNALFPLNDGGLRARLTYTLGLEYSY